MSEVRFGRATLPECCGSLSRRLPDPFSGCFQEIYSVMQENTGQSFGDVFREKMRECMKQFPLTQEDCQCFLHFAEGEGFADGCMQLRIMEQEKEWLLNRIEEQERELSAKSRMAVGLGAMSGLLLVVILL